MFSLGRVCHHVSHDICHEWAGLGLEEKHGYWPAVEVCWTCSEFICWLAPFMFICCDPWWPIMGIPMEGESSWVHSHRCLGIYLSLFGSIWQYNWKYTLIGKNKTNVMKYTLTVARSTTCHRTNKPCTQVCRICEQACVQITPFWERFLKLTVKKDVDPSKSWGLAYASDTDSQGSLKCCYIVSKLKKNLYL
jgi:hypothetical protein